MTTPYPFPLTVIRRDEGGGAASAVAAGRARAVSHAARARQSEAEEAAARAEAQYRARIAAAVGVAAASAGRAAVWVSELAARAGSRHLAEYAAAVLACGRDLDPGNDKDGGVDEDLTFVLSGQVLVRESGLNDGEGLALAAVGAIALAMPRTITVYNAPDRHLPELAHHLNLAVDAGRRAAG